MTPANRFMLRCLKELGAVADVRRATAEYSNIPLIHRITRDVPLSPMFLCTWSKTKLGEVFYSTFHQEFGHAQLELLGTYLSIYSKAPQLTEKMVNQLASMPLKKPAKKTKTLQLKKNLFKLVPLPFKKRRGLERGN